MVMLAFCAVCALVGCLLYLPFFFWFRSRRRRGIGTASPRVRLTRWGRMFNAAQALALLAVASAVSFAPRAGGPAAAWRGVLVVLIVFNLFEMAARRAGVVFRHVEPEPHDVGRAGVGMAGLQRGSRWAMRLRFRSGPVVTVHLSFVCTGLAIALLVGAEPLVALGCGIACMAIFALHELGHAVAARRLGLKVFAIDLSAAGGLCRTQVTRSVGDTGWVFAAGLLTQLALIAITMLAAAVAGVPDEPFAHGLFLGFTVANAIIIAINLVPGRTEQGTKTDGAVLWELWRHVRAGAPHPLAELHASSPLFPAQTRLLEIDDMTPPGFSAGVEMLNDDSTPMEFVADMLRRQLSLAPDAAMAAMLEIHSRGGKLFPVSDLRRAEEIAGEITRAAREAGHPLTCRAVQAASPARASDHASATGRVVSGAA
jgi:ATP-dependent Clp protease adapter protein ClpS